MRLHLGCRLTYELPQATPIIALLTVHPALRDRLARPDRLRATPPVPLAGYGDAFGNRGARLVAPPGLLRLETDAVLHDSGAPDPACPGARQHPVEDLPDACLPYLLGSRYCETDRLSDLAWDLFGGTAPGWARVQAVCDWVHGHVTFGYGYSDPTQTAEQTWRRGTGVCRDFTHLAVTLCRALNIPARYCTGYVSDLGLPPPYEPMDFAAWMEVYLGDRWWVFDPRNNAPRRGRVLVARGRDATDVPLTHTFGPNRLIGFEVITEVAPEP